MADNLKAAGYAAGLTPEQQKRLDDFSKSLSVHETLTKMPSDAANQKFNTLTPAQQADLVKNFGNEDPVTQPSRSPLGTAWHYTGGAIASGFGKLLAGLQNASDFSTRLYRTGAIALDQGLDLGTSWTLANDKGDKVFSPNRIDDAKVKFGNDAVDIAMRIASGEDQGLIMKSATPNQVKYLQLADPTNKTVAGMDEETTKAARANFQDTLDAVNAAKYSPGRFVANLVTPAQLEGSGLFYKPISGAVDAAYRVLADPTLLFGKAKRMIDVSKYAVDVVLGGAKVDQYFSKAGAVDFWNQYGTKLNAFKEAKITNKTEDIIALKRDLHTLAPQFGDDVIKAFENAAVPIQDAKTAKAFFLNQNQALEMFKGAIGRQRVLMPTMDLSRKLKVAAVTTGRKVFNIDAVGPKLADDYFFGGSTTTDGIAETIINNQKVIVDQVKANQNFKGIARVSTAYIQHKLDRVKALGTQSPLFENELFDLTAKDSPKKIYQLARVGGLPQRESKMLATAFENTPDVGTRMNIYKGLWGTIGEIRGTNTTLPGQDFTRYLLGKNGAKFGLDDAYTEIGSMPSDFNHIVAAPGMKDLDRLVGRNALFQKMFGLANSDLANKMISAWSFLTLAGPRYAIRNAGEDLMVHLAIGGSPWGLAKEYQLNSRINTFLQAAKEAEGGHNWANNPLGAMLRFTNRREVASVKNELTGIKTKFDNGRKEMETLKRELNALPSGHPEIAAKRERLETISADLKGGLQKQVQEVFANTLTAGRINSWRKQLNMKPMNATEAEILKEQIKYANLQNSLADVSEGAMNMFTGNDYVSRSQNIIDKTGVSTHALTFKSSEERMVKKPGERVYVPQALHQQDQGSMYSWMLQIGRYANDELGGIAVANLDNPKKAIDLMTEWMNTKAGKKFMSDARLADKLSEQEIATLNFNRAKALFVKRDKTLNEELLNKIRVKDEEGNWIISGNIGIDDLPTNADDIPAVILGPTLVPAVEIEKMTSNIIQHGWTFLGISNARMSRQPMVLNEIVNIRKQFKKSGFEDEYIKFHQMGIDPTDTAKMAAAKEKALGNLAVAAEERAIQQTIAYVDNPLVRSQLSWNLRNFARFYRATEDFYRRMYRVLKYNPEALVKASLTYEGITHSGWIQQDDQGNAYFVYPGISTTYNAIQNVLDRLGIAGEFKIPMPVNFGANLKMITPSLNPDSLFPTFSGPIAALPLTAVEQLVNVFNPGAADTIVGYAMGKYAVDQPIISRFLPAHVNRIYAAMNTDERNSQYASAYRKAVTYNEAAGHGIPKRYDADGNLLPPTSQELETYRQQIKSTVLTILGLRVIFGFFAPASPQVTLKSDMAQWISDNGKANFKQSWNSLLAQYPGDYDAAMAKWVELYPNQIPFTVTESERKTIAPFRYAEEAGWFVNSNEALFKEYPKAAAYLMPHKSGFSFDAYRTMKSMGLIGNKRVEDYLQEVQTAAGTQQYFAKKNEFESSLANAYADFEKTQLRKDFEAWKKVFFAGNPLVADELAKGQQKALDRLKTLDELTTMLKAKPGVAPKTEAALEKMVNLYQSYKAEKDTYDQYGGNKTYIDSIKADTLLRMQKLAEFNENTKAAYDTIFGTLLGD
jgi:hypothetical protein